MASPSPPSPLSPAVSPRPNPLLQLYSLIKNGQEEELEQFLTNQENTVWLDRKDSNGETALMVATKYERLRAIDILFDHGANPNTTNPYGPNPPPHNPVLKDEDLIKRIY
jgi:ankyrin repeat protein